MKISYKWLKDYVPDLPGADKLRDVFTYHLCEVEGVEKLPNGDTIFDINILPNRAHDLLCHRGVAFELAGLLGLEYKDVQYKIPEVKSTDLKIKVESDKCRRYMGRIVRNVKVGPSPDWVREHLESIGQRSINNIVDAANLVMFDRGNPIHAFDLDKIQGGIVVRLAKEAEKIITLDNKEVVLNSNNLVIADEKEVLAIAGVKGGKKAEVDENTKNIIVEVANFDPVSVRKTAHQIKIHTDAVKRFENDLSPELCEVAMNDMTALILQICSEAEIEEVVDYYPNKQQVKKIEFNTNFINKKLGSNISAEEIEKILKNYKYDHVRKEDSFEVIVPLLRLDLETDNDMVEEVGRVIGYDKIENKIPKIEFKPKINDIFYKILWARNKLLNEGYADVMTYTFREKGKVEVLASASDKKFLRTNLADGLKESYELNKLNAPLLDLDEIKIFEIGTIWNPEEEIHIAYADKKGVKEFSLDEFCKDLKIEDSYAELLAIKEREKNIFKPWSQYPFIARDIAVWLSKEENLETLVDILKEEGEPLLVKEPRLFDQYEKDGKISYAYRLVFQSKDRTLTDEEINKIMTKVGDKIAKKGWQIR